MRGIFLDQETTGLDPRLHRTIDIAIVLMDLTTGEEIASYETIVFQDSLMWEKKDPTSVKINGFTWEAVATGKEVPFVSEEIIAFFKNHSIHRKNAVFICQNPAFDRAFFNYVVEVATQESLGWPYHWLDLASMFWASRLHDFKKKGEPYPADMGLSKDDIACFFGLPPEKKPHRAMGGVRHLIECYKALFF